MIIEFNESLITGIIDIDMQHKNLFDSINKLSQNPGDSSQTWSVLLDIQAYASEHFETEEPCMRQFNYPEIEEHIKEHKKFLEDFKKIKEEFEKTGFAVDFSLKLQSFLAEWITNHYKEIDVKMADFLKKNNL